MCGLSERTERGPSNLARVNSMFEEADEEMLAVGKEKCFATGEVAKLSVDAAEAAKKADMAALQLYKAHSVGDATSDWVARWSFTQLNTDTEGWDCLISDARWSVAGEGLQTAFRCGTVDLLPKEKLKRSRKLCINGEFMEDREDWEQS